MLRPVSHGIAAHTDPIGWCNDAADLSAHQDDGAAVMAQLDETSVELRGPRRPQAA